MGLEPVLWVHVLGGSYKLSSSSGFQTQAQLAFNSFWLTQIWMFDQLEKYWASVRSNLLHSFLELHTFGAPFTSQGNFLS
jgi:hypothetical protein